MNLPTEARGNRVERDIRKGVREERKQKQPLQNTKYLKLKEARRREMVS
jgi:hypothetical protein